MVAVADVRVVRGVIVMVVNAEVMNDVVGEAASPSVLLLLTLCLIAIGLIAVALYLIVYYRALGVVVVLGLPVSEVYGTEGAGAASLVGLSLTASGWLWSRRLLSRALRPAVVT